MIHKLSTGNRIALIAAIVALACVGALLSVGLVSSEPFSDATLGMDWQCSRVAFVMTTCRRVPHGAPVPVSERKETSCWRSAYRWHAQERQIVTWEVRESNAYS